METEKKVTDTAGVAFSKVQKDTAALVRAREILSILRRAQRPVYVDEIVAQVRGHFVDVHDSLATLEALKLVDKYETVEAPRKVAYQWKDQRRSARPAPKPGLTPMH